MFGMDRGSLITLILTNTVLVITAVWRMSSKLQKIESQLESINTTQKLADSHIEQRLALHEANTNQKLVSLEARLLAIEHRRE
jgi:hypothetical protein